MAKFRYRMQNILDIKMKLEEQEKIAFSQASANVRIEQEKLKEIMIQQAGYERELKELSQGPLDITRIKTCKNSITTMKVKVRDQMIQVSKAQKQLETARQRLNNVIMERKMHENLRDKALSAFVEEMNHEESKITDELVSYTFFEGSRQE